MEIAISRGLNPNDRRFHLLSSVLGGFGALGMVLVGGHGAFRLVPFLLWCALGLFVGLVCGQFLRLVNRTKMEKFSTVGRLLIMATIAVAGGLFYWNILSIDDNSPAGRYPIAFAFILIPALIGSAIFCVVVYFILRLFGVRVLKNSDDDKAV